MTVYSFNSCNITTGFEVLSTRFEILSAELEILSTEVQIYLNQSNTRIGSSVDFQLEVLNLKFCQIGSSVMTYT